MHLSVAPLLALGLLGQALAAELTLYLPAKPNPFGLSPSTHATLSSLGQHYDAPLSALNTFVFHNVSPGSYLVDVHSPSVRFQPLRVDITEVAAGVVVEAWETFRGNDWGNKGERLLVKEGSAGKGVELRAVGTKNYYAERPKCKLITPNRSALSADSATLRLTRTSPCPLQSTFLASSRTQ
jgi:hypothetical protein